MHELYPMESCLVTNENQKENSCKVEKLSSTVQVNKNSSLVSVQYQQ